MKRKMGVVSMMRLGSERVPQKLMQLVGELSEGKPTAPVPRQGAVTHEHLHSLARETA